MSTDHPWPAVAQWSPIEAMFNSRLGDHDAELDALEPGDPEFRELVARNDELVDMKWRIYDALFAGSPTVVRTRVNP